MGAKGSRSARVSSRERVWRKRGAKQRPDGQEPNKKVARERRKWVIVSVAATALPLAVHRSVGRVCFIQPGFAVALRSRFKVIPIVIENEDADGG